MDAAAAYGELAVFHNHTLVAWGGEVVVDDVGESTAEVEDGVSFVHELLYFGTAAHFVVAGKLQLRGVGVGGMEVEGNGAYVGFVFGYIAHGTDAGFIDLVDGHVEADVICGGGINILHNALVGVAAYGVVVLGIAIQTQQDEVRLRQIQCLGAVGNNVDDAEPHLPCFYYQISQAFAGVFPQKGFSAAKEEDAHAHVEKLLHFFFDLLVGVDNCGDVVDGAMLTVQVAAVCYNDGAQYRFFSPKDDGAEPE